MKYVGSFKDMIENGTDCPYCEGKKAIPRVNSFKALHNELMEEFSTKNVYDPDIVLDTATNITVWEYKKCGMEWHSLLRNRVSEKATCPYCAGKKAIPGKTSFKALHPDMIKELNLASYLIIDNPDNILDSNTSLLIWNCENNHSYSMSINRRLKLEKRGRQPCPNCKGLRQQKLHFI